MRALAFVLSLFYALECNAQTVVDHDTTYGNQVRALVVDLIQPIMTVLPRGERAVAESIEIHVVPEGPWLGPRAGVDTGKRIIVVPELYAIMQQHFVEALILAELHRSPNLIEWWTTYALWRLPPLYDAEIGGPVKSPTEFVGYSNEEILSFYEQYGPVLAGLSVAALTDIILHEVGHHVLDLFYDLNVTSRSTARAMERRVDAWASEVFTRFSDKYPNMNILDRGNLLGRMIAIYFLKETESFSLTSRDQKLATHPGARERVARLLHSSDCVFTPEMEKLCAYVAKSLNFLTTGQRDEEHYEDRALTGEVFALYQLARLRMARGDYAGGCSWLDKDIDVRGPTDGYTMLGWCYADGHLGKEMEERSRRHLASVLYCKAKKAGWVEGAKRYEHMIVTHNIRDHCRQ